MIQKGMFWHVHYDRLLEYCYSYDKRVAYIKNHKPANEIETRLRLFQPVKGKLPKTVIEACAACDKAYAVVVETCAAYRKTCAACDKAYAAYDETYAAYRKAIEDSLPEIEALHARECPDCPWDGKQLVF